MFETTHKTILGIATFSFSSVYTSTEFKFGTRGYKGANLQLASLATKHAKRVWKV